MSNDKTETFDGYPTNTTAQRLHLRNSQQPGQKARLDARERIEISSEVFKTETEKQTLGAIDPQQEAGCESENRPGSHYLPKRAHVVLAALAIFIWVAFIGGFILAQKPIQAVLFILYGVIAKHLSGKRLIIGSGSIPIGN